MNFLLDVFRDLWYEKMEEVTTAVLVVGGWSWELQSEWLLYWQSFFVLRRWRFSRRCKRPPPQTLPLRWVLGWKQLWVCCTVTGWWCLCTCTDTAPSGMFQAAQTEISQHKPGEMMQNSNPCWKQRIKHPIYCDDEIDSWKMVKIPRLQAGNKKIRYIKHVGSMHEIDWGWLRMWGTLDIFSHTDPSCCFGSPQYATMLDLTLNPAFR